jgi:outer membrane protein TolC
MRWWRNLLAAILICALHWPVANWPSAARIAGAATEPGISTGGAFGRTRFPRLATPQPIGGHTTWNNHVSVDLAYDLDLWGRNRAILQAALDGVQATAAEARAVQINLETSVVRAYVDLALQYALLDVNQANLVRQRNIYDIVHKRASRGLASELEVSQAQTQIPALLAQVQQSERQVTLAKNQIAILSGQGPGAGEAPSPPSTAGDAGSSAVLTTGRTRRAPSRCGGAALARRSHGARHQSRKGRLLSEH